MGFHVFLILLLLCAKGPCGIKKEDPFAGRRLVTEEDLGLAGKKPRLRTLPRPHAVQNWLVQDSWYIRPVIFSYMTSVGPARVRA